MPDIEFHIGLLPTRPIDEIARIAREAEDLGFAGLWIADSQSIFRDAYAALTLCAERTRRLHLATGVTNPVTRHPAVIAGAIATLAEQSRGRAILGVGVGESAVHTIGERPATLDRLREVIGVIGALLSGETTSFDGRELVMSWPVQPAPIYLASSGPRSLRLAGEAADGVLFQVGATPDLVRYALDAIAEGERAAGRSPGSVRKLVRLACVVDDDRQAAREQARGYVAAAAGTVFAAVPREHLATPLARDLQTMKERYDYARHASSDAEHAELLTDRIIDAISIGGTPDEAIPRFRELIALGVDGFVVPVATTDPGATVRTLAERVMQRL